MSLAFYSHARQKYTGRGLVVVQLVVLKSSSVYNSFIMDLPNLFSNSKKEQLPEKVLAILLSESKIQTLLLGVSQSRLSLESSSRIIEYDDPKRCYIQIDEALQQLGQESEGVNSVVFGLEHSWIDNGEILEEYQGVIAKVTDELSLKPVGFIDTSEALSQYSISQNSLYSGILLFISDKNLNVSYLSQGKTVGVELIGRSESIVDDLKEGLARFSKQLEGRQLHLPSKVTMASFELSQSELKKLHQQLVDFDWLSAVRFLQAPIINVISEEEFTNLIAIETSRAAAIAVGFYQVASVRGKNNSEPNQSEEPSQAESQAPMSAGITPAAASSAVSAASLGASAVSAHDASTTPSATTDSTAPPTSTPPHAPPTPSTPNTPASLDTSPTTSPATTATTFGIPVSADRVIASGKTLDELDELATTREKQKKAMRAGEGEPATFLGKLKSRWQDPYAGRLSPALIVILSILSGIVVSAAILTTIVYFSAQMLVVIDYKQLPIKKNTILVVDPAATDPDPAKLVLPGKIVTQTVSQQEIASSTGTAIVGDNAAGKVTIYNKTLAKKTFAKGTVLSYGEIKFTLDEEVTIASASVKEKSDGNETDFGKSEAKITAANIGDEANLKEGEELTVDRFSSETYSAKVTKDGLVGGESREVQVVSQQDMDKLLDGLRESLLEKANKELKEKYKNGVNVFPASKILEENARFDVKEKDEVSSFSLLLSITVEAITYKTEDVKVLAAEVLKSDIPEGYKLSDEPPQILTDSVEGSKNETSINLKAQFETTADPVFDLDKIRKGIVGKSIESAETELKKDDNIKSVEFFWKPSVASKVKKSLPGNDKVTIELKQRD